MMPWSIYILYSGIVLRPLRLSGGMHGVVVGPPSSLTQAIRKLRGLGPAYWHHQSTTEGDGAKHDGKLEHAQRYLEEKQVR